MAAIGQFIPTIEFFCFFNELYCYTHLAAEIIHNAETKTTETSMLVLAGIEAIFFAVGGMGIL